MKKEAVLVLVFVLLAVTIGLAEAYIWGCPDKCMAGDELKIWAGFYSDHPELCEHPNPDGLKCCWAIENCPSGTACFEPEAQNMPEAEASCRATCTGDSTCPNDVCISMSNHYAVQDYYCDIIPNRIYYTCRSTIKDCPYNYKCDRTPAECYDACAGVTCPSNYCLNEGELVSYMCQFGACIENSFPCFEYGCSAGHCVTCAEQSHDEECNYRDDDCDFLIDEIGNEAGAVCCAGVNCSGDCIGEDIRRYGNCNWGSCNYNSQENCSLKDTNLTSNFCKGNDVYFTFRDYSCKNGACSYTDVEKLLKTCLNICYNGQCRFCIEGSSQLCTNQQGVCKGSFKTCVNDVWTPCNFQDLPFYTSNENASHCDDLDNDCDGVVDEGCSCEIGTKRNCGYDANNDSVINKNDEVGICRIGVQQCITQGVWGNCIGSITPLDERCGNGLDDDCDGQTDENCGICTAGQTKECGTDEGICQKGVQTCLNSAWTTNCGGNYIGSMNEICGNGLDDDCDGQTDENCGICTSGQTMECGTEEGICQKGTLACINRVWTTNCGGSYIGPMNEVCNGLDDDCDGGIDETCVCINRQTIPCGIDVGECKKGTRLCQNGAWSNCVGDVHSTQEVCDGKDNDCDGLLDEGLGEYCSYFCGNGVCDVYETPALCPADCKEETVVPTTKRAGFSVEANSIKMANGVFNTRILEINDLVVTVENVGGTKANNVKVKLEAPFDWEVTKPVYIEELRPLEKVNVSFRIISPFTREEEGILKINVSSAESSLLQLVPTKIEVPDFLVAPMPSFERYIEDDEVKIYTVINNRKVKEQVFALEVEFNLNKRRSTLIAEMSDSYDLLPEEVFVHSDYLSLSGIRGRLYTIHATLYKEGKKIHESDTPFDLRTE